MRMVIKLIVGLCLSAGIFILVTNLWIVQSTKNQIFYAEDLPKNDVGLVLGTSKRTSSGNPNRFFVERMNAAARLFNVSKVRHILVSGDNRTMSYNEPRDMFKALENLNIPEEDISLDFAGFRTLDSVVRSKAVFGQDSITIITQQFHCYRSLFIANHFGIHAIAYASDEGRSIGFKLAIREVLARSFAVADLYIFGKEPKFLGEEIELDIR